MGQDGALPHIRRFENNGARDPHTTQFGVKICF